MTEPQDIFCGKTEEQTEVFCDTVSLGSGLITKI